MADCHFLSCVHRACGTFCYEVYDEGRLLFINADMESTSVSPSIPGAGRPALFAFLKVILFYMMILYIVELQLPFSIFY